VGAPARAGKLNAAAPAGTSRVIVVRRPIALGLIITTP
jgi:hypothetical protein